MRRLLNIVIAVAYVTAIAALVRIILPATEILRKVLR